MYLSYGAFVAFPLYIYSSIHGMGAEGGEGGMKRYILIGLLAGAAVSVLLYFWRRRELEGTEFRDFFDSSSVADDQFGDAFAELPDKL